MTPDEFRKIRKASRMTQAQLAEHLGKSRLTINNWETGKYKIPDDALDTLVSKGVVPGEPKETAKQKRDREEAEAVTIQRSVETYRRIRAWPQYGYNHTAAMAYLAREGTTIDPRAYAAIVAEFPDILTDPNGNYPMTREQSAAVMSSKPSTPSNKE